MPFQPNEGQHELIKKMTRWIDHPYKPIFVYSGGPGTGKTTVFKHFLDEVGISNDQVLACAYSGKAVNTMNSRGLKAHTIHSTFYIPTLYKEKDEFGDYIIENDNFKYKLEFVLRPELSEDKRLIVIDELSMVPDKIMQDILSFGIPTIGMGDIDQLPPIFGSCSYMMRPDFYLTEIMRQNADNPIIWLCQQVNKGERLIPGTYGESRILEYIDMGQNLIDDYDIIITCRNKTRDMFNDVIRKEIFGRTKDPVVGDKIICRQNVNTFSNSNDGRYLTNGTIGYIDEIIPGSITGKKMKIDFVPEYDLSTIYPNLEIDMKYISMPYEERADVGLTPYLKFEYGYAITAHLSQGSEYPRVLYIDEPFGPPDLRRKLRYTAISRASEKIDIVLTKTY